MGFVLYIRFVNDRALGIRFSFPGPFQLRQPILLPAASIPRKCFRCHAAGSRAPRAAPLRFRLEVPVRQLRRPRKDLNFGYGQGDFAKTGDFAFAKATFDDSKWRDLNLPHDWAVELPFVHDDEQKAARLQARRPPLPRDQRRLVSPHLRYSRNRRRPPHHRRLRRSLSAMSSSGSTAASSAATTTATLPSTSTSPTSSPRRQKLHRRPRRRQLRRRLVLRGRRHLSPRLAHQDRRAPPRQIRKLRPRRRPPAPGSTISLGTVVENSGAQNASAQSLLEDPRRSRQDRGHGRSRPATDRRRWPPRPSPQPPMSPTRALWSPESPTLYSPSSPSNRPAKPWTPSRCTSASAPPLRRRQRLLPQRQVLKIQGTCNHQDHAGVGAALPDRLQYFRLGVLKEMGRTPSAPRTTCPRRSGSRPATALA
jgi:beta-galactosidase